MFLSDASLKRPVAMTVFIISLAVLGIYSYLGLGLDFLPEVDVPVVTIMTVYPGAGPEEVETLVTDELEEAVSEVNGIDYVQSTSMENVSQIIIIFDLDVDIDAVANDVREKVQLVRNNLPTDVEEPTILKFDPNAKAIATLALAGDRPLEDLYELADDRIRDQLTKIPGLASVEVFGGKVREIQVLVDQESLAAHHLSLMHVIDAIGKSNLDMPGGRITENRTEFAVRLQGEFENFQEIADFQLTTPNGDLIPLSAVATVRDGFEEQRELATLNGRECVGLVLKKQSDANMVAVVDNLLQEVDRINASLPGDMSLEVVSERSGFIRASNNDVIVSLLIGIALTSVLLFIFLHDIRQTIITAVAMPVSVVTTFLLIRFGNFTLNIMTMMALAISVGILVTNAIVVLENIYRHFQQGKSIMQAAKDGTSETATAVFASTLTNIVVFVPIAFMSGMIGQFFMQFGLTVAFATIVSLFVSFTLTPILSAKLIKENSKGKLTWTQRYSAAFNRFFDRLSGGYGNVVDWALRHRFILILLALGLVTLAIIGFGSLGADLVPDIDQAELTVEIEMAPGTPLEETYKAITKLESFLADNYSDLIEERMVRLGKLETVLGTTEGVHVGSILLKITPKSDRSESMEDIAAGLRSEVGIIPGATVRVTEPSVLGGSNVPVEFYIMGPEFEQLAEYNNSFLSQAAAIEGMVDTSSSWKPGKPEIRVVPNRLKMRDSGLTVAQLAMQLRGSVEGIVPGEFRVGKNDYDIRVQLQDSEASYVEQIEQLNVPLPNGRVVPLLDVAETHVTTGPTEIHHYNKQRAITITSDTKDRALGDVLNDISATLDGLDMPAEYSYSFSGHAKILGESISELFATLILAIILTYLVLCGILESYLQPVAIMLSLPLAFVGAVASLLISGQFLSIFALLSMIMLVGIVVNNAILIIDYANFRRDQGAGRTEALLDACRTKLRPIIMTTLATIAGMLPLALSRATGSEIRVPMGIITIGGMLVSAVLALLVIPVVYTLLDDLKGRKVANNDEQA